MATGTFKVNQWYRGGTLSTITLHGASTLRAVTSAGRITKLEPGTRLLVAGDGGFAWSCGYTRAYDASTATKWRQATR